MTRLLVPGLLAEGDSDVLFLAPLIHRQLVELTDTSARCVIDVATVQVGECHTVDHPDRLLAAAVELALDCDLLFVHHDHRERSKADALVGRLLAQVGKTPGPRCVKIVPIRTTEAWMLADRDALTGIRGADPDVVPMAPRNVEGVEKPKQLLACVLSDTRRHRDPDYFEYLGEKVSTAVLAAVPAYAAWVEETTRILKELRYI